MFLQPYANQVTGHDCLLTTADKSTICKVKNANELDFYLKIDPSIQPFTPEFKGTVNVTILGGEIGKYAFEAHFDKQSYGRCHGKDLLISQEINRRETVSAEAGFVETKYSYNCRRGLDLTTMEGDPGFQANNYTQDIKNEEPKIYCGIGRNPWAARVQRIGRHVAYTGRTIPYILLENVCRKFEAPCILDLKIGTQIYADDCPREKLRKHQEKNRLTTTSALGIRLAGMQVYQDGVFVCRDKFYGRGLSIEGLASNVKAFFTDGENLRTDVVEVVIERIRKLKSAVSALDGCRFYGSSVVAFYEGDRSIARNGRPVADLRVLDFAHSTHGPERRSGPDKGFLFGLSNFQQIVEHIAFETRSGLTKMQHVINESRSAPVQITVNGSRIVCGSRDVI